MMLQRFGSGLLASGFVALLLKVMGMSPATLKPVQLLEWQNLPVFALPS